MSDLKFIYRIGKCNHTYENSDYCGQCHTCCADDLGCKGYASCKKNDRGIPFGDCIHATHDYKYKGISFNNYECEYSEDEYNPHLNCISLTVGGEHYECEQLFIDGVEAFKEQMEGDR